MLPDMNAIAPSRAAAAPFMELSETPRASVVVVGMRIPQQNTIQKIAISKKMNGAPNSSVPPTPMQEASSPNAPSFTPCICSVSFMAIPALTVSPNEFTANTTPYVEADNPKCSWKMKGDAEMYANIDADENPCTMSIFVYPEFLRTGPKLAKVSIMPVWRRSSAGSVSLRYLRHIRYSSIPQARSTQKTPSHEVSEYVTLPRTGATTGATLWMDARIAMNLATSSPLNVSVIYTFEITSPPAPASPWMNRNTMNDSMFGEKMQHIVANTKIASDIMRGVRRPYLSLMGPTSSCPAARPVMLADRVSCDIDDVVANSLAIVGRLER